MKTLLSIVAFFSFGFPADGQTMYFSADYFKVCKWNGYTQKFDDCSKKEESSLFTLNAEQTMFHHTTPTMKSSYYVTSQDYDEKTEMWTYKVKSDVGNDYVFLINLKDDALNILGKTSGENAQTYLITHHLKNTWKDGDDEPSASSESGQFRRDYEYVAFYTPKDGWSKWTEGTNTFVFNINDNADFTLYNASGKKETFRSISKIFKDMETDKGDKYQLMRVLDVSGEEIELQLFNFGDAKLIYPSGFLIQFTNSLNQR